MNTYLRNNQPIGQLIMIAHDVHAIEDPQTVYLLSQIEESEAAEIIQDLINGLVTEDSAQTFVQRMIENSKRN